MVPYTSSDHRIESALATKASQVSPENWGKISLCSGAVDSVTLPIAL
jgi:hypothetical protein